MFRYLKSRRYYILLSFILFGLLILPIAAEISVDLVLKPQVSIFNIALKHNYPKILDDLEMLHKNKIFKNSAYKNNAEYLISKYVSLDGVAAALIAKNTTNEPVKRITKVYHAWRSNEEILKSLLQDKELMSVNTDWLERLHNYDHWNFSTNKELTAALATIPNVNALTRLDIFSQLPSPNYDNFRSWAILHFLQMTQKGQSHKGLKTYRKVANLIHSSSTVVGNITAASMLKDEYILTSKFGIKGWATVPVFYIDAYIRTTWAWMGLLKLPYFNTFPVEFLSYLKPETGICASSRESVSNFSLYLDLYQPQTRFERNFTDNVIFTTHLYQKIQKVCNLEIYDKFLSRSPASLNPWSSFKFDKELFKAARHTDYDFSIEDNWVYLPYIRRIVGTVYFAGGSPMNYVSHYERKKFQGLNYNNIY